MKKTLGLILSLSIGFLSFITVAAVPARAQQKQQQVASLGKSLKELKEEYERMLLIERNPDTPAEVRELNQKFLAERRTQLREAFEQRLSALRGYRVSMGGALSADESLVVEKSIRETERELSALADKPAARKSGRARRSTPAQKATEAAFEPDANERFAGAVTSAPAEPEAAPAPKSAASEAAPLEVLSPAEGATVSLDNIEVEIAINSEDIDDIWVTIHENAEAKPFGSRKLAVKRSDRGKKTVPIHLRKGANRIEVSSSQLEGAKVVRVVNYRPAADPAIGNDLAAAGLRDAGFMRPRANANAPVAANLGGEAVSPDPAVFRRNSVTGFPVCQRGVISIDVTTAAGTPAFTSPLFVTVLDGTGAVIDGERINLESGKFVYQQRVELAKTGTSTIRVLDGLGNQVGADLALASMAGPRCDDGNLVGMLVAGQVSSQQADRFSQNDPFFGFIAGYSTERHWFARGQVHFQFQGIFQVQPKKDEAPVENLGFEDPAGQFVPFLSSRKSFDVEGRIWIDWGLPPSKHVRLGPYFSVAGTTYVSRNELRTDESITVEQPETPADGGDGESGDTDTGDTVKLDPTQAKIDNDIDLHWGLGMMMNVFNRDNSRLFMNVQIGYENYEGLAGLNPEPIESFWDNSRNRVIGKLRIFPTFLNVAYEGPEEGGKFSPMFGVEVNAGRGPDQLKFFIGGAVGIGAFKDLFSK